jgi:hypothetical protein
MVEAAVHLLADLEHRNDLLRDCNSNPGPRIAAYTSIAPLGGEHPKSTKLNPVPLGKRIADGAEDRVHNLFEIPLVQMRVLSSELLDQFGFDHGWRRSVMWRCFP